MSREALPGACGQGDIYFSHRSGVGAWAEPERLLCAPAGPNSELDEQGPSYVDVNGKVRSRKFLYVSPSSVTPNVAGEIFVSTRQGSSRFGTATAVTELNDATANESSRSQGRRVGGRVYLEPLRDARRPGSLERDARADRGFMVVPGQSRQRGEHECRGDEAVALAGWQAAPVRPCTRAGGVERHLRDDAIGNPCGARGRRAPSLHVSAGSRCAPERCAFSRRIAFVCS